MSDANNKSPDAKCSRKAYRGFNATASPDRKENYIGNEFHPYGAMSHIDNADFLIREEDCSPISVQRLFNNFCGEIDLAVGSIEPENTSPIRPTQAVKTSPIDPGKLASEVIKAFGAWERMELEPPDDRRGKRRHYSILKP